MFSGAVGEQVRPLYGDASEPYRCAQFFMAIDVAHFRDVGEFSGVVSGFAERVRTSRRAPGVDRVMSPGEPAWRALQRSKGKCTLGTTVYDNLRALANELGVAADRLDPRIE